MSRSSSRVRRPREALSMMWNASGKLMGRPAVNRPEYEGIFIKRAPHHASDFPLEQYTGLLNSGGYTRGVNTPSAPNVINFIFLQARVFRNLTDASTYSYWFTKWPAPEPPRGGLERYTTEQLKEEMLAIYRDDQPFISELISSAAGRVRTDAPRARREDLCAGQA